jgi:hypothetical protein
MWSEDQGGIIIHLELEAISPTFPEATGGLVSMTICAGAVFWDESENCSFREGA